MWLSLCAQGQPYDQLVGPESHMRRDFGGLQWSKMSLGVTSFHRESCRGPGLLGGSWGSAPASEPQVPEPRTDSPLFHAPTLAQTTVVKAITAE